MAGFGDDVFARWSHIQGTLFPWLREELDPITAALEQLIIVLDTIGLAAYVPGPPRHGRGRKPEDRRALARAFVAKAVLGLPTTAAVIERLAIDKSLRRICGWESAREVPSEATFSRAFAEFAASELPDQLHEALIKRTLADRIVGCVARDATEIDAREKPAKSGKSGPGDGTAPPPPSATPPAAAEPPAPRRRGRPKKGEERPKPATRLERQAAQTLPEMLAELPTCKSAWNKDPVLGVIGVQKGPPERRVHNGFHGGHGGRARDADCGDGGEGTARLFSSKEADQGDLSRVLPVAQSRAQGDPCGSDGVSL